MSSTRLKNQPGEYNLEQLQNIYTCNNRLNAYRTKAKTTSLPVLGFNPSHIPSHILSSNSTDIESQLFGVGSTNLVTPQKPVEPRIHSLDTTSYFERPDLIIPEQFVFDNTQRPIIP